jgi:hypothetical protein
LRWIVFAEQLRQSATMDIDGPRRELDEAEFELTHPNQAQADMRKRVQIGTARLGIAEMIAGKESARATLWPEDKPAAPVEE